MSSYTPEQAKQACDFITTEIYGPVFFETLQRRGVVPKTAADTQKLLKLGAMCAEAKSRGLLKDAGEEENPFLEAATQTLGDHLGLPKEAAVDEIKQNSHQMAKTNQLAKAAALIYADLAAGGKPEDAKSADDKPADTE